MSWSGFGTLSSTATYFSGVMDVLVNTSESTSLYVGDRWDAIYGIDSANRTISNIAGGPKNISVNVSAYDYVMCYKSNTGQCYLTLN